MKVTLLGSGTSTGVPRVGNDWGECDPAEPRNRRSRVSIVVESDSGERLLVDTSPDLRNQLLDNGIGRIDGVFWTHDHADHTHGIDDLRSLRFGRKTPIPGFAEPETARRLKQRFSYIFAGEFGYSTIVDLETLERLRILAGFAIDWCTMPHGPITSTGLRFEADGKSVGYATDFSKITPDMLELFDGVDVLIADCLRREPHPSHSHLSMTLELAHACAAGTTILTHMDKSMDYRTISAEVPDGVQVGYDGMQVVA
ncbi:MBL fold metallo-hydrolase [Croceibacterium sp. TMG7-5b_MA50]|uniref:MBL fold metallo-hydrolase n=1 Tax=Croceibacterium sp. TMG7-5b_MA50 TaxID=3121290 RepID=UPI003222066E